MRRIGEKFIRRNYYLWILDTKKKTTKGKMLSEILFKIVR